MKFVYLRYVFTFKTTVILLKKYVGGLDQLYTGHAGGSSRGKGFNNIFSILS